MAVTWPSTNPGPGAGNGGDAPGPWAATVVGARVVGEADVGAPVVGEADVGTPVVGEAVVGGAVRLGGEEAGALGGGLGVPAGAEAGGGVGGGGRVGGGEAGARGEVLGVPAGAEAVVGAEAAAAKEPKVVAGGRRAAGTGLALTPLAAVWAPTAQEDKLRAARTARAAQVPRGRARTGSGRAA